MQNEICKILGTLSTATFDQIKNHIPDSGSVSVRKKISNALHELKLNGRITRSQAGIYRALPPQARNNEQQNKIWRAMRYSASFSIEDIVVLSEASRGYVHKYASFLVGAGYLVKSGKNGEKHIFRITDKATVKTPCFSRPGRARRIASGGM